MNIKGRDYDVTVTAGSDLIHTEYWHGDEAGCLIGGPILGHGIPIGARIEEVLSLTTALMNRTAERSAT